MGCSGQGESGEALDRPWSGSAASANGTAAQAGRGAARVDRSADRRSLRSLQVFAAQEVAARRPTGLLAEVAGLQGQVLQSPQMPAGMPRRPG